MSIKQGIINLPGVLISQMRDHIKDRDIYRDVWKACQMPRLRGCYRGCCSYIQWGVCGLSKNSMGDWSRYFYKDVYG